MVEDSKKKIIVNMLFNKINAENLLKNVIKNPNVYI